MIKKIWILLFTVIFPSLLVSVTGWAQAQDREIEEFEASLEEKVRKMARVQFGDEEVVAPSIAARIKKEAPPTTQPEILDTGYLLLPTMEVSEKTVNWKDNLEGLDVTLMVSSRVDAVSLKNFRDNVVTLLKAYRPRVNIRKVAYSDPESRKPPPKPTPPPPEVKPPPDELLKKDKLNAAIWGVAILIMGICIWLAMQELGKAVKEGARQLGQGLLSKKQPGNDMKLSGGDKKDPRRNGQNALGAPSSLVKIFEKLKTYSQEDPMKLAASIGDSPQDLAGLRWLLSQLPDEDRQQLKDFIGVEKIRTLLGTAVPEDFDLLLWGQSLCEVVAIKKIEGGVLMERALASSELAILFKMDMENSFAIAHEKANPAIWRMTLDMMPESFLIERSQNLKAQDWVQIIAAAQVTPSDIREAFPIFNSAVQERMVNGLGKAVVDTGFEQKMMRPLVGSLKTMPVGRDEEFLATVGKLQPRLVEKIQTEFWPLSRLRDVDSVGLKNLIAAQSNESLHALLLVLPLEDAEMIKTLVPEGMKRTVVLDLLERSRKRGDAQDINNALIQAREFMDQALQLHRVGKLPLKKVTLRAA